MLGHQHIATKLSRAITAVSVLPETAVISSVYVNPGEDARIVVDYDTFCTLGAAVKAPVDVIVGPPGALEATFEGSEVVLRTVLP